MGHWIIPQLERMAKSEPHRFEELVLAIGSARPDIFDELHLMAVEHGQLSETEVAERLNSELAVVKVRLDSYREASTFAIESQVIEKDRNDVARIIGKQIAVWEIVREYRKRDSVDAMRGAFPLLSEGEMRAALIYAGRNPDEIGSQIRAFEEILERNKAAYPYAKES